MLLTSCEGVTYQLFIQLKHKRSHPFSSSSHESNANDEHDDAHPLVDLWVFMTQFGYLILQLLGCLGCEMQVERVILAWWVVEVDA